jgi:hypothetical protein
LILERSIDPLKVLDLVSLARVARNLFQSHVETRGELICIKALSKDTAACLQAAATAIRPSQRYVDPLHSLLRHQMPGWRHGAFRRSRRDRERQPCVPARWTIGRIEFAVAFQVQISLHVSDRENISDLRTDAEHAGLHSAQDRELTEIVGDLLIRIADQADEDLLREKLRGAPVEVEINSVLILRILVLEIVRESGNAGKFVPRRRIEIGVTAAAVDSSVTDPKVGEAAWIVSADGNISRSGTYGLCLGLAAGQHG